MRRFIILFFPFVLAAGVYKAKIEPYDKITVKSEVSGRVVKVFLNKESKEANGEVIEIDHALESKKLKNFQNKLKILNELIEIKRAQYNRIKNLRGENLFTKERYKNELLNLLMQREDLLNIIAELKDRISKKIISVKNMYIKKIYVREGEFVNIGAKLMDLENQNGSRIVIFVDSKDRENLSNSDILIDGKKSGFKIEKAFNSPDIKYISSYRVELVSFEKLPYGKLVDVEIKRK